MTQINRPQKLEDFENTGDKGNMFAVAYGGTGMDVLDQPDTISIEELGETIGNDPMTIAGVDELTPVDTFLEMQGDTTYVTKI